MDINSIGSNPQVQRIVSQPVQRTVGTDASKPTSLTDRVELSGMAHLMKALKSNDVRADKVADIRAQIAAGTYDDEKKLDIAVDRLLDDLSR